MSTSSPQVTCEEMCRLAYSQPRRANRLVCAPAVVGYGGYMSADATRPIADERLPASTRARESVVKVGGIPELGVTKRTNILVAGDINPAVLAPGVVTTGKAAKVFALQDKGQDIEVMTQDDFPAKSIAGAQPRLGAGNRREAGRGRLRPGHVAGAGGLEGAGTFEGPDDAG